MRPTEGVQAQLAFPLTTRQEADRCDLFGCGDPYPFGHPDFSHMTAEQRAQAEEMSRLVHEFAHDLNKSDDGYMLGWSVPPRRTQPERMELAFKIRRALLRVRGSNTLGLLDCDCGLYVMDPPCSHYHEWNMRRR